MSQFLCKTIVSRASSLVLKRNPTKPNVSFLSLRWYSVSCEDSDKQSFVVSYLMNSFGFSLNKALVASKYLNFKNSDKSDNVIEFFKSYGFSETQIIRLVRAYPLILRSDTTKTILPKLEFFKSKGMSVPELGKMLSYSPRILLASLGNRIIPSYDILREVLQSDEKTIAAVKLCPDILASKLKIVLSNSDILREHGVPDSIIAYLIQRHSMTFVNGSNRLRKVVEEILKMGFNVSTTKFATALRVSLGLSESTRQKKVETYKKCDFSEEEISKAFRRDPHFIAHSQGKVIAIMDFFANEMSWSPSLAAIYASVFSLSLQKRIIPRCSVYKVLRSNGLVKESKVNLRMLLLSSEEIFLKKFVDPYEKKAPELLKIYREKLALSIGAEIDEELKFVL